MVEELPHVLCQLLALDAPNVVLATVVSKM
jgi:hypothetical protein